MKRRSIRRMCATCVALLVAAFCNAAATAASPNPLLVPSTLPFGAPPFDLIKDGDYEPAIDVAMAQERGAVARIADNSAPPTFENTIVALERAGQLLDRVTSTFYNVSSANVDPTLQNVEDVEAPRLAAFSDAVYLNHRLFKRVATLYANRAGLHLDPESAQLLNVDYQRFVRAGAQLGSAQQAKLKTINERLATLQTNFERELLHGTAAGALVVHDAAQLAGMSATSIANAAHEASLHGHAGAWMIPLQNTTQQPALATLSDRATRKALFEQSWTRTEKGDANDTRDTIATMAALRAEKAAILGYRDFAAYALTSQMAKNPATVQRFLSQLIAPTRAAAAAEATELQALIGKDGGHFQLQPYDWNYYAEQLRKAKYDFDESQMKPYFELNTVLTKGLFYAANQLYGITFKERHDIPVYQKDVRVFEVYDKDGSPLALMYFDFFKRDNKEGGAWMSTFVNESKLFGTKPVVYNVENIPKPAPGEPALLTSGEVSGMFHEFGHALNAFFATQKYASLAGTNTARDFVEYPSQFNEHWAFYPKVLRHYAFDYKTHQPIPASLIAKLEASSKFNVGYSFGELLAADELDMAWHSLPASAPKQKVDAFETSALAAAGVNFPAVPPRYRSSYFAHIWSSGYAAGYYAYTWTAMLDDDTYQWFLNHGGMTRANGQRFRDLILSRGHSEDYAPMFRAFYGKDPQVGPLLDDLGLSAKP
ncbi:MAG TPA: M3 family metallopeptidase [Candidatus Baltobacteraceae bacterium]|nr:M3 family metallopeptidase [Candidatus Baltobacteraceae bacterium]